MFSPREDKIHTFKPPCNVLLVFSLNKGENWFAALTNIAILKTQKYWREMITWSTSSLVKIWKISYCVFSVSYSLLYNDMDYIVEHIEFTKIMHRSREPPKLRREILQMFVQILPIYAAANIELRNCLLKVGKFDIFNPSYILYSRIWSPYWIVICLISAILSHISGNG